MEDYRLQYMKNTFTTHRNKILIEKKNTVTSQYEILRVCTVKGGTQRRR